MTEDDGGGSAAPIPGDYDGGHPASGLLALLGRSHTMAVLFALVREDPRPWRYSELEDRLDVAPNTLSARLDELEAAGLVTRRSYDEIPPRVEYEATQKARDLQPVFASLREWADRYGLAGVD
jgi:DNA-binding HxlR family transcriptional regulator